MTETKKTVEQLKAEYEALTAEVKDIQERLVALQPAVDEFGRLSDRLQELNGYGRSKVILAKLALKDALFEREIGTDPHKPVIAEGGGSKALRDEYLTKLQVKMQEAMSTIGVSSVHTTGEYVLTGSGGSGYVNASHGGCVHIGEWLPPTTRTTERTDDTRLTGPKLVIDEETGKGYWR